MSRTPAAHAVIGSLVAAMLIAAMLIAVPALAQTPDAEVEVGSNFYAPETSTVEVGQTVRWTVVGGSHNVTQDEGAFTSPTLRTGDTYEQTFTQVGEVQYYCSFHSTASGTSQNGVINVVAAGEQPTEQPTTEPTEAPTDEPTEVPTDAPDNGDPVDVDGTDPVTTALSWSALLLDGNHSTAFIGTSAAFADSLASGTGQGTLSAPLLLTPTDVLDQRVADELVRLGVSRVIILGGEAAISADVEAALNALDGVTTVERAQGQTRLETSRAVADLVAPDAKTILLARQDGPGSAAFADSLAAGAVGARNGWPVVLTRNILDDGLKAWLATRQPDQILLVGGTAAISEELEEAVRIEGYTVQRFAGVDRVTTAAGLQSLIPIPSFPVDRVIVDGFGDLAWASGFASTLHAGGGVLLGRAGSDTLPGDTAATLAGLSSRLLCGPTITDESCRQARLITQVDFDNADLAAVMDDEQEVNAMLTGASGLAALARADSALCLRVRADGLSGPVADAHVHEGPFGEPGGVVMPLNLSRTAAGLHFGCSTSDSTADAAAIITSPDDFYLNLHTELNPGGEIRGQLFDGSTAPLLAVLAGANEVPPVDGLATGAGYLYDTGIPDQLCTGTVHTGLEENPPTLGHIHDGPAGENGPVVFNVAFDDDGFDFSCVRGIEDTATLADIFANPSEYYVNLHNTPNPGGVLRGQFTENVES